MNEKRRKWLEENNIAPDGFKAQYCLPDHVYFTYDMDDGTITRRYFVGWDGRKTTWDGLTEEEKADVREQNGKDDKFSKSFFDKIGEGKDLFETIKEAKKEKNFDEER